MGTRRIGGIGLVPPNGGKRPELPTLGKIDLGVPKPPSGGSSGGTRANTASDTNVLSGLIADMYDRFAPQEVQYTAKSEEEIRNSVASWLRPSYDQAISNRQKQTKTYKANLDADAIARGMGASTYVTDVKNRQQNAEATDIASLESDYGSTLSRYVSEGVENETDRVLEVQKFNAQQRQNAYELAYSAAMVLFEQYKRRSSGGGSSKKTTTGATSRENCEAFLSQLSGQERREVYEATSEAGATYRAELLASVGSLGYVQLMGMYPSAP
ncbi:MAG: hypothetical protein R2912_10040 [Eubacteriales bacterium]